jgi:hypothetical protein
LKGFGPPIDSSLTLPLKITFGTSAPSLAIIIYFVLEKK